MDNHSRGDVHESLFRGDRAATLSKKPKGRADAIGNLSLLRKVMQAGACESWQGRLSEGTHRSVSDQVAWQP